MPEGPEIRIAADRIAAVLEGERVESVELNLAPIKQFEFTWTESPGADFYRLLELERAQGDAAAVNARLQELIRVDATAGSQRSDRTRFLAAKASLELAEPVLRRFTVVKLDQPLAESMKLKRELMEDVIEVR